MSKTVQSMGRRKGHCAICSQYALHNGDSGCIESSIRRMQTHEVAVAPLLLHIARYRLALRDVGEESAVG